MRMTKTSISCGAKLNVFVQKVTPLLGHLQEQLKALFKADVKPIMRKLEAIGAVKLLQAGKLGKFQTGGSVS